MGRKNKCHFSELCKDLLATKYKIPYLSTGFLGQIQKLSEKQSISDIIVFKKVALETIALDGLSAEDGKIIKSRTIDLINKIQKQGHPWYNETWKDNWLSLVFVNDRWFKQLWGKKELSIIKSINKEIKDANIFESRRNKIPSSKMLVLKDKFDQVNCT